MKTEYLNESVVPHYCIGCNQVQFNRYCLICPTNGPIIVLFMDLFKIIVLNPFFLLIQTLDLENR